VRALATAITDVAGEVAIDGELPVVLGQRSQLAQLLQNLIGKRV